MGATSSEVLYIKNKSPKELNRYTARYLSKLPLGFVKVSHTGTKARLLVQNYIGLVLNT